MSNASTTNYTGGKASGNAVANLFARIRSGLETRRIERAKRTQLMRELNSMTDRDLADLGLGRGDIDRIALGLPVHR